MKYLVLLVAVVALGWFAFTRTQVPESRAAKVEVAPVVQAPPANSGPSFAPRLPSPPAVAEPTVVVKGVTAPNTTPVPINLTAALGPDNQYHDDQVGVKATFPEGWTVREAFRWGKDYHQNTVFLTPDVKSSAVPSMYYQQYLDGVPAEASNPEAYLRKQAQDKESSRIPGRPDYKNVPESFSFFDVDGRPALSYFATFSQGEEIKTEYFIRVLGPTGYVMFFTTGKLDDVKAIMPQIKKMAASVKGP